MFYLIYADLICSAVRLWIAILHLPLRGIIVCYTKHSGFKWKKKMIGYLVTDNRLQRTFW